MQQCMQYQKHRKHLVITPNLPQELSPLPQERNTTLKQYLLAVKYFPGRVVADFKLDISCRALPQ